MSSGLPFHRRLLRHVVYRTASAVAAVTEELRNYHAAQAWWNPEAINVLYNGVDGQEFSPQPQVRDAVRARLGIPTDALVVGSVGRMVPLKDFTTLLKAAEALVPETPNLHVVLVGSGPELSRLQDYAADSLALQDALFSREPSTASPICSTRWTFLCCPRSWRVCPTRCWKRWRSAFPSWRPGSEAIRKLSQRGCADICSRRRTCRN